MGLDIYHHRATLMKPLIESVSNDEMVIEEQIKEFNVPFQHFEKYIQKVDFKIEVNNIIIYKDFEKAQEWFQASEYNKPFIYQPNPEILSAEIEKFEQDNNLLEFDNFTYKNDFWDVKCYFYTEKRIGFYIETVGYQRKGVNGHFWERFYNEEIYNFALFEDFEYAYQCVDKYWHSDTDKTLIMRKADFKRNFLDNFIDGASYLYLSY